MIATSVHAPSADKPTAKIRRLERRSRTGRSYHAVHAQWGRIPANAWYIMRALSIRQPYAEMILRGEKTIEYRSRRQVMMRGRASITANPSDCGVRTCRVDIACEHLLLAFQR